MQAELNDLLSGPQSADVQAEKEWLDKAALHFKNHPSMAFQRIALPLQNASSLLQPYGNGAEPTQHERDQIDFQIFLARVLTLPAWNEKVSQMARALEQASPEDLEQLERKQLETFRGVLAHAQRALQETYEAFERGSEQDLLRLKSVLTEVEISFHRIGHWIQSAEAKKS